MDFANLFGPFSTGLATESKSKFYLRTICSCNCKQEENGTNVLIFLHSCVMKGHAGIQKNYPQTKKNVFFENISPKKEANSRFTFQAAEFYFKFGTALAVR